LMAALHTGDFLEEIADEKREVACKKICVL
jgi:hypothetical protein